MTIQEVGDREKWLEILEKTLFGKVNKISKDLVDQGELRLNIGNTRIEIISYTDLHVYVYISIGIKHIASIQYNGSILNDDLETLYRLDTNFICDTEGISMLVDVMKRMKYYTPKLLVDVIKESEKLYKAKFYGKLAGNKFGF